MYEMGWILGSEHGEYGAQKLLDRQCICEKVDRRSLSLLVQPGFVT